jgi:hypothetical protein
VLHDAGELPQPQTRDPHVHPLPADLTGYPAARPVFSSPAPGDGSGLGMDCLQGFRLPSPQHFPSPPNPPLPSETGEGGFRLWRGRAPFSPLRGEKGWG